MELGASWQYESWGSGHNWVWIKACIYKVSTKARLPMWFRAVGFALGSRHLQLRTQQIYGTSGRSLFTVPAEKSFGPLCGHFDILIWFLVANGFRWKRKIQHITDSVRKISQPWLKRKYLNTSKHRRTLFSVRKNEILYRRQSSPTCTCKHATRLPQMSELQPLPSLHVVFSAESGN